MFSKSTQFTHESRVSTIPWPMHPPPLCHARDLSHAFWLARTQTPRIVRLHRWILLDRTVILIPFDNTCTCFQIAPPKKCFQRAHSSHTKAVCLPNRARCPLAARAIWVEHSDWPEPKPHGSYVCTVGCSQIERQSSSLSTGNAVRLGIDLYANMHGKCQKMS